MNLDFAFLANSGQVSGGLMNVLGGGIDFIEGPVPIRIQSLVLFARVLLLPAECEKKHTFRVKLLDPRAKEIRAGSAEGTFQAKPHPRDPKRKKNSMTIAFNYP